MKYRYKMIDNITQYDKSIYGDVRGVGNRSSLRAMIDKLHEGDIVEVEKLSDIARDVDDFLMIYKHIKERGANLVCSSESDIVLAIIELSKTKRIVGRPSKEINIELFKDCYDKWTNDEMKIQEMQELLGYKTKAGVYKAIERYQKKNGLR